MWHFKRWWHLSIGEENLFIRQIQTKLILPNSSAMTYRPLWEWVWLVMMPVVELLPLDKGHRLILDPNQVTTVGRTPNIGCVDKKISRNHAELYVKPDGTVWIKPIHSNPTFFKTKTKQLITLDKDQEHQLYDSDEIGLLPTDYFYRISIQSDDEEPSTIPKPIAEATSPPLIESPSEDKGPAADPSLEPEGGVILHTKRALPVWMSHVAPAEAKPTKGSKPTTPVKTPSPSKRRSCNYLSLSLRSERWSIRAGCSLDDGRKQADSILYDDDDEEVSNGAASSTGSRAARPCRLWSLSRISEASRSKKRERCPYGKFCYRKNPVHRQQAIHPGDPDWEDKENETTSSKPVCPYGSDCYRKNPDHFTEFDHTEPKASKRRRGKSHV